MWKQKINVSLNKLKNIDIYDVGGGRGLQGSDIITYVKMFKEGDILG